MIDSKAKLNQSLARAKARLPKDVLFCRFCRSGEHAADQGLFLG
jgi:hypothetical protein